MAKVQEFNIKFLASDSPDVVTNRLYYVEQPVVVDYDAPFVDIGNEKDVDGYVNVNLGEHLSNLDGVYNIGVAAVDDVGNEATMTTVDDVPLDFVAPNPVGSIEILVN